MSVQPARSENTMTVALVTFSRSGGRKEFAVKQGTTVIGRRMDADLRIPISSISRAHCEIVVSNDEVLLRDLDSSNGTFLNDEQVTEAVLSAGDRVRVGPIIFVVQIDGEPRDISMSSVSLKPAAGKKASPDTATTLGTGAETDDADFDLDQLEELDVDDLSDLDLDEIDGLGSDDLEEIENEDLEELSDDDLVEDDGEERG